ncbi:MAG: TlpA disulfide reductase family protein [Chthoniobacteraceae bacterium]
MPRSFRLLIGFLVITIPSAWAADAEADWNAVIALDAGPQRKPSSAQEAQQIVIEHLGRQERALRKYLADHSASEHGFDAQFRLAGLLMMRGEVQGSQAASSEAEQILSRLEKQASPEERVDLDFVRLTQRMRAIPEPSAAERQSLLNAARQFQAAHPTDRRVPAVLAEVATRFNSDPKTKQALLLDALHSAPGEDLKIRIRDDLRGLELLGNVVNFEIEPIGNGPSKLEAYREKVVVLVFFAVWSEPSIDAVDALRKAAASLPKDRLEIVGVSLDTKPERLAAMVKEKGLSWPILCDGKGWESPAVRRLGINALPTVWILDAQGRLRSLDGLNNLAAQIRPLLRNP